MADLHNNIKKGWNAKWQEYEDEIIKQHYPSYGYKGVQKYIKNRSKQSIQQRALRLGVKYLSYNKYYFDIIDSHEKAYWLGFLYADGYVTKDDRWGLELSSKDKSHIQNLLNAIEYTGIIKERTRGKATTCSFLIKNKHMTDSLINNGVVPNKTYFLEFPNEEILSSTYYNDFIRGFFDGDGSIYFNYLTKPRKDRKNKIYTRLHKELNIVCQSEKFIKKLQVILKDNNINTHLSKDINGLFTLRISSLFQIKNFYNFIYSYSNPKIRLERKFNKFNDLFIATTNSDVSKKIS